MSAYDEPTQLLVRGLVHAARNAMQRSQTALSFLRLDAEDNAELLASVEELEREADALAALLEAARRHVEPHACSPRACDVAELVRTAWTAGATPGRDGNLAVAPDRLQAAVDPELLGIALAEVFANAEAAGSEALEVAVTLAREGDPLHGLVTVEVTDNGPGFSKAALERALEPFWSAQNGRLGLGLSRARNAMVCHGGDLRVSNVADSGASLSLVLRESGPDSD